MTIPTYQELMLPVLRIAGLGETRVPDAAVLIADQFGLSEAEREERLPSGGERLLWNRIHWAKFYMAKAGLIDSPRHGRFVISDTGRALLTRGPKRIDLALLKTIPSFLAFYKPSAGQPASLEAVEPELAADVAVSATPEEQIEAAHAILLQKLKVDLLDRIKSNSPAFFERLIVDLLVGMGYGGSHENAARELGRSGDGGVDGVIDEDRLGLDRIYVQAKRYTGSVGRPEIQGFVGSLVGLGAGKGVFVTTSNFSAPAIDFVRHLPQRVILIDGARLVELMVEHKVGVSIERTVEIDRLDENFFDEE